MRKKYKYDIAHKVMRVELGDYDLLLEVSRKADIPMAEALHLVLKGLEKETGDTGTAIPAAN